MPVIEISPFDYARAFGRGPSAYDSPDFLSLNSYKVPQVRIVALTDSLGRPLVAQAFGLKADGWHAPFSAPFSCPAVAEGIGDDEILSFYKSLPAFLGGDVHLTFPAECYGKRLIPDGNVINDYNYHYPLSRLSDYEAFLSRSGRYSHRRALRHPFEFSVTDDLSRAYDVIRINRESMGYPLAMSLEQVRDTAPITGARYFVLSLDGRDMAAAIVFNPMPEIAQIIYWGDVPEARPFRAMNNLPWHLFIWYAEHCPETKIVDIGPSSTDGVLNRGLADYKLSIGCVETPKPSVTLCADPQSIN